MKGKEESPASRDLVASLLKLFNKVARYLPNVLAYLLMKRWTGLKTSLTISLQLLRKYHMMMTSMCNQGLQPSNTDVS